MGDVLITGQFIPIDEGVRAKRAFIGFGMGSGKLQTTVEGYLVTHEGHRLLSSRQVATAGAKKPSLKFPGVVAVATSNPAGLILNSALTVKGEKKKAPRLWRVRPGEQPTRWPRN